MHPVQSPRTDDSAIEQEILHKGLTAPRITPADIEGNIASEWFFTAAEAVRVGGTQPHPLELLTFCVLVLHNGFTVTGESACASPENFDAEIGRKIARANAVQKVWPLMGYALRTDLWIAAGLAASLPPAPEGMQAYSGTKQLFAKPMTRGEYNAYRRWASPPDEAQSVDGYLVEYVDGGKPNDERHAGYISWSPADVFERSYRPL